MALIIFQFNSFCLEIAQIKKKSLILKIQGDDKVQINEIFYVFNENQKKVGIIKIKKIKGKKALATYKGKIKKTFILKPKNSLNSIPSISNLPQKKTISYGAELTYNLNTFNTPIDGEIVNMSGSSLGFLAFAQYYFKDRIALETQLHYFPFNNTSEKISCSDGKVCHFNANFIAIDIGLLYLYPLKNFQIFGKIAGRFHYPIGQDINAIENATLSYANSYSFKGGVSFHLSPKGFLTLGLEHNTSLAEVNNVINFMTLSAGYGFKF